MSIKGSWRTRIHIRSTLAVDRWRNRQYAQGFDSLHTERSAIHPCHGIDQGHWVVFSTSVRPFSVGRFIYPDEIGSLISVMSIDPISSSLNPTGGSLRDEFGLERVVPGSVYRWLAREYDLDVLDDEAQELLISHDQVDSDCAWPDDEDWPYKDFEKDWDEFALEYDMSECDYSGVLWLDAWGLGFQYPEAEEIGFQPLSRKKPIKKRRSGRS